MDTIVNIIYIVISTTCIAGSVYLGWYMGTHGRHVDKELTQQASLAQLEINKRRDEQRQLASQTTVSMKAVKPTMQQQPGTP